MKVAVITTCRADWNALGMVALELRAQGADVEVFRYAGSDHGEMIAADGLEAAMFGSSVTKVTTDAVQLVARDAASMKDLAALTEGKFDMAVVLGDRHEVLVAVFVLIMVGVRVAHVAGGDVSGGSLDEHWRHTISKMAHIHFPTNHEAASRLIAMGERPEDIYMLGSPSVDRVLKAKLPSRVEVLSRLKISASADRFLLVNWQAEAPGSRGNGFRAVLDAMRAFPAMPKAFVGQNSDPHALDVQGMIFREAELHPKLAKSMSYFGSIPASLYLGALKHASALIGNSSSGFYEAPYFGTPVVNVGDRQRGRSPKPECMQNVRALAPDVEAGVAKALRQGRWYVEKPFGAGDSARKIAKTILSYDGRATQPKLFGSAA